MSEVSKITSSSSSYADALNEKFAQKRYERSQQNNSGVTKVDVVEELDLEELQNSINYANITHEELTNSFIDVLMNNIATNASSAANQNWTNVGDGNINYWTDNPLKLTLHEGSGSYLIEQQDENGNWVAMGYTDESTAQAYLEKINLLSKNNGSNYSDDILAFKEEQMTGNNPNDAISSTPIESNSNTHQSSSGVTHGGSSGSFGDSATSQTSIPNDINNDGVVDASDALQMMQSGDYDSSVINSILTNAANLNSSADVASNIEHQTTSDGNTQGSNTEFLKVNRGEEVEVDGITLYCYGTADDGTKIYSNSEGNLLYKNKQGEIVPILVLNESGQITEQITTENIKIQTSPAPGRQEYFTPSFYINGFEFTVDNISTSMKIQEE